MGLLKGSLAGAIVPSSDTQPPTLLQRDGVLPSKVVITSTHALPRHHREWYTTSYMPPKGRGASMQSGHHIVDPTRSTDRCDSLLNGRKKWVDFRILENPSSRRTIFLWSRHLLLFLFLNGENQVRTKNPNDSSMEKKRSAKTRFLGPGIRLPIGKVTHMR